MKTYKEGLREGRREGLNISLEIINKSPCPKCNALCEDSCWGCDASDMHFVNLSEEIGKEIKKLSEEV